MLATKHFVENIFHWVYGPYRKRYSSVVRLEHCVHLGSSKAKSYAIAEAQKGIQEGAVCIVNEASAFRITIPPKARLDVFSGFSWKTIWNGSLATTTSAASLELKVAANKPIRVQMNDETWTWAVFEERELATSSWLTKVNIIVALRWLQNFMGSGLLHVAAFALLLLGQRFELPWMTNPVEVSLEQKNQPVAVEIMTQQQASENDFAGHGLSLAASAAQAAAALEAKAQSVAQGLSGIAARMSRIALGVGSQHDADSKVAMGNSTLGALAAKLGLAKGTAARAELQKIGNGGIKNKMGWDLYGAPGTVISLKEQEQLADIFRSLQGDFRNCYESALLKDSELSVNVQYEAEILSSGTLGDPAYAITGRATSVGEESLKSCLTSVLRRVRVGSKLSGMRVKNEFIFRS